MSENALVLLSGGVDSAVALYWALARGWKVHSLEFDYHLRPGRERRACLDLRSSAPIKDSVVVPVTFIRETVDLPPGMLTNPVLANAPEGYVPSRNLIFYSIAAYYAEIWNARFIVGGHNRTDHESFPDAGKEFLAHFEDLLRLGMWSYPETCTRVVLPLIEFDKSQVIALGRDLHVPYEYTWSCYCDSEQPCGVCVSCVERGEAFHQLGLTDPLT
jgi:7-cyano-7-deazaguanine synthase